VSAKLSAIIAFRLTTAKPERLASFYQGLGFTVGEPETIPNDEIAMLGLDHGGVRLSLHLGEQRVDLDHFADPGRPYPADATSADLCFQHFALVTSDAAAVWARATALGALPISFDGPVILPASAGGVTAVKFRDPEGHPLELLQPPAASVSGLHGAGLLGIDHSAISVADAGASRRFYEALGLSLQDATLNQGATQMALDGLAGAKVDVLPMMPSQNTPHLELLAYRNPTGRPADVYGASDIAATRIVWAADRDTLLRDPDGHLHLLKAVDALHWEDGRNSRDSSPRK
jgi:catechol 2,3-dioxygenase-like lactoylglutathione lyase family enzyme